MIIPSFFFASQLGNLAVHEPTNVEKIIAVILSCFILVDLKQNKTI